MEARALGLLIAIVCCSVPTAAQQGGVPDADFVERVVPAPDDLGWNAIPWRVSYAEGVLDADRLDRPVLLWAMNGHPLGCT